MDLRIIDTTLRDGEQKAGVALGMKDKVEIASILSSCGIYQIEAGIPAMGGSEKKSVARIAALKLTSRISAWNRLNKGDITHSMDCGVDIIHISVPSSNLQIQVKLQKDPSWVVEELDSCITYARENGFAVHVGLEDASRGDMQFLIRIAGIAVSAGAEMVRYADTVGILHPSRIANEIKQLRQAVQVDYGFHAHNDFGMAVANSLAAVKGGALYIDCTVGGIGERTGNCNYLHFMKAVQVFLPCARNINLPILSAMEEEILTIIGIRG